MLERLIIYFLDVFLISLNATFEHLALSLKCKNFNLPEFAQYGSGI